MTDDELEALARWVEAAALNVEHARNRASLESLAGWEHLTMRETAAALRAMKGQPDA